MEQPTLSNRFALLAFMAVALSASYLHANEPPRDRLLRDARTVVFLGDSITFGGGYVADFEAWLLTQKLVPAPLVINVGLPSETVSGLSEEGHADGRFPRPDLAERLDRVLSLTKPDLVFACYGINCGIYEPLGEERFGRYREGMERLKQKVEAAGATLVVITPPSYDDQRKQSPFSYNAVLAHYSDWLLARRADGWLVVDLHGPMTAELARRRQSEPDFTFQPDAVHPNDEGHWFMARQLIRWFGDAEAAEALSPEAMLEARRISPDAMKSIRQRMALLRDAYLGAAGHLRPGIRAGLPVPEALEKVRGLSEMLSDMTR
ncbi:MAG: SGNH/GDSL hydrolase family protein [Patescibacteria group bacterium]|nr:SGNH/GDSL hydrolase family protein [Patescibacteria group bacterium]